MSEFLSSDWMATVLPSVIGVTAVAGVFLLGALKKLADEKAKKEKPSSATQTPRRKK